MCRLRWLQSEPASRARQPGISCDHLVATADVPASPRLSRLSATQIMVATYAGGVIPTLIMVGFIAGMVPKGWLAIPVAAIAWPVLLIATDVGSGLDLALGGGFLAAANTAVGVAIGLGLGRIRARRRLL